MHRFKDKYGNEYGLGTEPPGFCVEFNGQCTCKLLAGNTTAINLLGAMAEEILRLSTERGSRCER